MRGCAKGAVAGLAVHLPEIMIILAAMVDEPEVTRCQEIAPSVTSTAPAEP